MSSRLLLASLFSVASLAACGGGGSDAAAPAPAPASASTPAPSPAPAPGASPAPAPSADTGSVSAAFAAGPNPKAVFFGSDTQTVGRITGFTQQTNGAVTAIGSASLGAPATVRDIHGDSTYAMGRWAAGPVAGLANPVNLAESGSAAYHYVLFNQAASLPAAGTLSCDNGTFTTPTYVGGTSVAASDFKGSVTGNAQLTFSDAGAGVKAGLTVSNSSSTGTGSFATTATATQTSITGTGVFNSGNTFYVAVGAAATGYDLIGGYFLNTASGARYIGAYRFHCQ